MHKLGYIVVREVGNLVNTEPTGIPLPYGRMHQGTLVRTGAWYPSAQYAALYIPTHEKLNMRSAFPRCSRASQGWAYKRSQSWVEGHTWGPGYHPLVEACDPSTSPRSQTQNCTANLRWEVERWYILVKSQWNLFNIVVVVVAVAVAVRGLKMDFIRKRSAESK